MNKVLFGLKCVLLLGLLSLFNLTVHAQNDRTRKQQAQEVEKQLYLNDLYNKAVDAINKKDYEGAVRIWKGAVEKGHGPSATMIGSLYLSSQPFGRDYEKASEWFRKAAELGDAQGQFFLGYLYYTGKGVKKSIFDAIKWYSKAGNQNYKKACVTLGTFYYNGEVIEKNYKEAAKWFAKSVEESFRVEENPYFVLGDHYFNRDNFKMSGFYYYLASQEKWENLEEDVPALIEAGEQGNEDAYWVLGLAYDRGKGLAENKAEAAKWYKLAAVRGHLQAQINLALLYEGKKAFPYWLMAAEQGDALSQKFVGDYYFSGNLVPKDLYRARMWYERALKNEKYVSDVLEQLFLIDNERFSLNDPQWTFFAKDTDGNSYYYHPRSILRFKSEWESRVKVMMKVKYKYSRRRNRYKAPVSRSPFVRHGPKVNITFSKAIRGFVFHCTDNENILKQEKLLYGNTERFFRTYYFQESSLQSFTSGTIAGDLKEKICY